MDAVSVTLCVHPCYNFLGSWPVAVGSEGWYRPYLEENSGENPDKSASMQDEKTKKGPFKYLPPVKMKKGVVASRRTKFPGEKHFRLDWLEL
jgi:hypothetical protein